LQESLEFHEKVYVYEAIEVEKTGLEVYFKKTAEFITPEELQNKFHEIPTFKTAFEALMPGRQRAYIFYFLNPNNPKLECQGLKNICSKF
jgi:uncharacterized protein YdeI (YjbR/CyaY-like superfamily)